MKRFIKWVRSIPAWYLLLPLVFVGLSSGGKWLLALIKPRGSTVPDTYVDGPVLDPTEAKKHRDAIDKQADREHRAVTNEYKRRRKSWIDKFRRKKTALAWLALALIQSCGGAKPLPTEPDPGGFTDSKVNPVDALAEACNPEPNRPMVCCPDETFEKAGLDMIAKLERLAHCEIDLKRVDALRLIDLAELRGQLNEARRKLASPWRSPWLWGAVGIVAGAALVVTATLSAQ